jgi:hypothetical protein
VPLDQAAREVNAPRAVLERNLQSATASLAVGLDADSSAVRRQLVALDEATSTARLPRASAIRREGRRRRRTHTAVAAVTAAFVTVASGAFAYGPESSTKDPDAATGPAATPPRTPPPEDSPLPSAEEMLVPADLEAMVPDTAWTTTRTHDNTAGDGINTVCQASRFADPKGLSAVVREFAAADRSPRSALQTMEVSSSKDRAAAAFSTVVGWYSGCPTGRLQLGRTYQVTGVGDRASVLELREWAAPQTSYTVGVAQVGQVMTFTVHSTTGGAAPRARQVVAGLATSAKRICARAEIPGCVKAPGLQEVPPPPSGEEKGILATVDMPGMASVNRPWIGTKPKDAPRNPAATSCDRAQFRRSGATKARTRTFLVPEAGLPSRFGLTETYGTFPSPRAARKFLDEVRAKFAACEDRDVTVDVQAPRALSGDGIDGTLWTMNTEVSEQTTVVFQVGFVQRGTSVAQISFLPAGRAGLTSTQFRALVVRAGDRLRELG